jgi:hypothetical protein
VAARAGVSAPAAVATPAVSLKNIRLEYSDFMKTDAVLLSVDANEHHR